ncbi:hypothetical protein TC41_1294 [Alicyclobacillus acidocaldarius subsp. acidocaldarius Tc-4-1]|uniref:Uncharacterized protein n=1 Tax=Alicyclobacillus acidocaldarius (strain Tc-4-1) TaxID=1048834 RepID=F8IHU3_ALIAT|nr:hypothetical protein TC41_1294 [Alicyclobacillus acidocaldarius subsp. acidocaldarius Tc-4-1]
MICAGFLSTGCTPAVQSVSIASGTATQVVSDHAPWSPLLNALDKSEAATMYKMQTAVNIQNGNLHTSFTVYGTIQQPNMASIQVHENNFNIAFYQQGQVAYQQDGTIWSPAQPVSTLNAYAGYRDVIEYAIAHHLPLEKMNRTYVVDEYCDVYRVVVPNGIVSLPAFLGGAPGASATELSSHASQVAYVFYVGETSGYIRQIQTQSVGVVDSVGSLIMQTTTIFQDINNAQLAKVQIPVSLVQQLEQGVQ